ncbi:MAG: carboxymuconolactone decarboxylase family protein [Melioribacteraceae bacterium]|nr:carboxymuconolactone decarboxylase family protein [Melioribacteraceae bacterium]WKZ70322.1 MAG: carboxymuconolactone decarboxylase family protein [Melioribacteraceae bacterium]
MSELPKPFKKFTEDYPKVVDAYEKLGAEVHGAGPINDKNRSLIKLAIAVGARMEGAVHSHTRKALEAGCTKEEIKHAVLLALPTIGLPNMMAAMTWVNDILES